MIVLPVLFVFLATVTNGHLMFMCTQTDPVNPGDLNFFFYAYYHGGSLSNVPGGVEIKALNGATQVFPFAGDAQDINPGITTATVTQLKDATESFYGGTAGPAPFNRGNFDSFACYSRDITGKVYGSPPTQAELDDVVLDAFIPGDDINTGHHHCFASSTVRFIFLATFTNAVSGPYQINFVDSPIAPFAPINQVLTSSHCSAPRYGPCCMDKVNAVFIDAFVPLAGNPCSNSTFPISTNFTAPTLPALTDPGTIITPNCVPSLIYSAGNIKCSADGSWVNTFVCSEFPVCIQSDVSDFDDDLLGVETIASFNCDTASIANGAVCHALCDTGFAPEDFQLSCNQGNWTYTNPNSTNQCVTDSTCPPNRANITGVSCGDGLVSVEFDFENSLQCPVVKSWEVTSSCGNLTAINKYFNAAVQTSLNMAGEMNQECCFNVTVTNEAGSTASEEFCSICEEEETSTSDAPCHNHHHHGHHHGHHSHSDSHDHSHHNGKGKAKGKGPCSDSHDSHDHSHHSHSHSHSHDSQHSHSHDSQHSHSHDSHDHSHHNGKGGKRRALNPVTSRLIDGLMEGRK